LYDAATPTKVAGGILIMAVATATVEGLVKRQNDNLVALLPIRHKKAGFVNYFIDKYKKI